MNPFNIRSSTNRVSLSNLSNLIVFIMGLSFIERNAHLLKAVALSKVQQIVGD